MSEPWFSGEAAYWFSFLAALSLLGFLQPLVRAGRYRTAIIGVYMTALLAGVGLFVAGMLAAIVSQPPHVFRTLLVSGFFVAVFFAFCVAHVRRLYAEAELRQT